MRLLALLHRPTTDPAGAERMLHQMMLSAALAGHRAIVGVTRTGPLPDPIDGIEHRPATTPAEIAALVSDSDIVATHLDATIAALRACKGLVPVVIVEHNTFVQHKRLLRVEGGPAAIVFNSLWMRDDYERTVPMVRGLPRVVVRPPSFSRGYRTDRGHLVTQINLFENKGGSLFWRIAAAMPGTNFLAVKGGYGAQVVPAAVPPNVEVMDPVMDPRAIYARTGVLLVPSTYESWGRVGVEAMASGIPVVAHPTPGLVESLSYAGVFRGRDDAGGWVTAITALQLPDVYERCSELALLRSHELDEVFTADLDGWLSLLDQVANRARS